MRRRAQPRVQSEQPKAGALNERETMRKERKPGEKKACDYSIWAMAECSQMMQGLETVRGDPPRTYIILPAGSIIARILHIVELI